MAVSIFNRPEGRIINFTNTFNAIAYDSSGTPGPQDVAFVNVAHGLSTSDFIYIFEGPGPYLGFWYVDKDDNDNFRIRPYASADFVGFVKAGSVRYYKCNSSLTGDNKHGWNCVHLPIVYIISNTLWPTNSADTIRTISSVTDSNGYCNITASGDIKSTGSAAALEFIKITNATNDDLNGVWQIITYSSDTSFIIDIPYSSANDTSLTNASIQYYYNNYVVKVQVWGGLSNEHEYYSRKPYELLATIELVPDENNIVKFSVSDVLKKQINIANNLLLGTLPNNLDAFTKFFIKYGEEYDDSDGTTLSRSTVSYTSDLDNFQGKAVNSKLPFKNIYSGAMSEYFFNSSSGISKFMSDWERPTIFQDKYFDLSFIWDGVKDVFFLREWYITDVLTLTDTSDTFDAFYTGVYRAQIESDCDYDRLDITAYSADGVPVASEWNTLSGAFDTRTETEFIENVSGGLSTVQVYAPVSIPVGDIVRYTVTVSITGTWTPATGIIVSSRLTDTANNTRSTDLTLDQTTFTANGNYTIEYILQGITSTATRLVLSLQDLLTSGSADVTITLQSFTVKHIGPNNLISETKTFDINCSCTPVQSQNGIYLSWINAVGGNDYWYFTAYKDSIVDITDSGESEENTFEDWPNSYGEFSDTSDRRQTFRNSRKQYLIRSQTLTLAQLEALKFIKVSPLVQIVNSIYDRRTVIVDTDSYTVYQEGQAQKSPLQIQFTITYTDDLPSQTV